MKAIGVFPRLSFDPCFCLDGSLISASFPVMAWYVVGPTAPRNVRLSTTMPGAITVVWQKPQFQNGVFHDYTVSGGCYFLSY